MKKSRKNRFAVFCSGSGIMFKAIIDEVEKGSINASVCLLIAGMPDIYAVDIAADRGIPYIIVPKKSFKSEYAYNGALLEALGESKADFAVLAGYLDILGTPVTDVYENKIINVHPSLIPKFCGRGYYGIHVHEAALKSDSVIAGATVHFVDNGIDTGPIILQKSFLINKNDTVSSLSLRTLNLERRLLIDAVRLMASGRIKIADGRAYILELH